jgi:hypothetical protein
MQKKLAESARGDLLQVRPLKVAPKVIFHVGSKQAGPDDYQASSLQIAKLVPQVVCGTVVGSESSKHRRRESDLIMGPGEQVNEFVDDTMVIGLIVPESAHD